MRVRQRARRSSRCLTALVCWAAALAAGVAVTGCSGIGPAAPGTVMDSAAGVGSDPSEEARDVIRRVADTLAAAESSQAGTALRMTSGGTRLTIHGEGAFDYVGRVGELRVRLPGEPVAEPVTELFAPGALYMKNRGAGVPPDKWVRVETASLSDGNLVTGGATDPITAAELLRGVLQVADLGVKEVGGELLRHYRGVTDIAVAAEAAVDPVYREQLAAAVGGFADTAVPFDAYLDEDGLLRKVRHRFSFVNSAAGQDAAGQDTAGGDTAGGAAEDALPESIDVTSTVVLFDFGAPVHIVMPEPEDIFAGAVVAAAALRRGEPAAS
ncbi:hypothetical protein PJ985_10120 [Streptomyces sp. ACA25]|uniref:hypothetical protein n=1 Tax=Streptomyces sp. ACA25 TaxID=3022596 RepID=UPI0023071F70|nr:hypothetical protein [Streptomyces sp. ACA25]MDB1087921.1 hypothetical protein [Streptomyces sp. ACA25]